MFVCLCVSLFSVWPSEQQYWHVTLLVVLLQLFAATLPFCLTLPATPHRYLD